LPAYKKSYICAKPNNMLRKMILVAAVAICCNQANSQQLRTPAPSPTQTVKQDFGISSVELIYSRPGLKGRKLFVDLAPLGKVWRTGANSATRIKFNDDVTFGGQPLKAGEYAIYTVPGEKEWEVIINKGSANWGTEYKEADDIFRVKVKPMTISEKIETFTMQFDNVKSSSLDLTLLWGNTAVRVPITTDIDKKVMAQLENAMFKDNRPYFAAAMYYMDTNRDLNQAVTWFDKALEQSPNAYWIYHQKANALAKLGKKDEARTTAQKSMDLATSQNNPDYVELNRKLLATLK
jgi:tetratricopeptide (TPR) repeat protein